MSKFAIHSIETAPRGSQPVLKGTQRAMGFIPNLLGVLANAPAALEGKSDGRIDIHVGASEIEEVEMIQIKVEDNGPGFNMSSVNQIFDPYVTTKPKGTGLGLAIVKKLVEEHVGSIRARNRSEGGAMISIRLPVNEAARVQMIARAPGRAEQRREHA